MNDIEITRGNDRAFTITVTRDGAAQNITGWTIFMTVKENLKQSDANALITKSVTSHTNAVGGISAIGLSSTDTDIETGNYNYDLKIKDNSGALQNSSIGIFRILPRVTERSS